MFGHLPRRTALLASVIGSLALCGDCDPGRTPDLTCNAIPLHVPPGQCREIRNPCSAAGWSDARQPDGFALCENRPASVFVRTERVGTLTRRFVCATSDSPSIVNASVDYLYGLDASFGVGQLLLTVSPLLTVTATAFPQHVMPGMPAQLGANASGGTPPYFYLWTPPVRLNNERIRTPIATPPVTTTYTVSVTDSAGQPASGQVTVTVGSALTVEASPPEINPGESSQLRSFVSGGTPPYTFLWTPRDTLDNPSVSNPLASPLVTTTYTVTASDQEGTTHTASIDVLVRQASPPSAFFTFRDTCCPPTLSLDALGSGGSIVRYAWDLSWTPLSPDLVTEDRLAAFPILNEADTGTITLTVTAVDGQTSSFSRPYPQ